jgi:hypothetical protein
VHAKSKKRYGKGVKALLPAFPFLLVAAIFERWMMQVDDDDDDDETSVAMTTATTSTRSPIIGQVNRNTINLQPNREDTDHRGALVINED